MGTRQGRDALTALFSGPLLPVLLPGPQEGPLWGACSSHVRVVGAASTASALACTKQRYRLSEGCWGALWPEPWPLGAGS